MANQTFTITLPEQLIARIEEQAALQGLTPGKYMAGSLERELNRPEWSELTEVMLMSEVADERARQNSKWGQQNHPDGTGAASHPLYGRGVVGEWSPASVLAEVFTERTNERASGNGDRPLTWADILLEEVFEALAEHDTAPLRTELIQIAAVATQWAEAIDRRMIGVRAHG